MGAQAGAGRYTPGGGGGGVALIAQPPEASFREVTLAFGHRFLCVMLTPLGAGGALASTHDTGSFSAV